MQLVAFSSRRDGVLKMDITQGIFSNTGTFTFPEQVLAAVPRSSVVEPGEYIPDWDAYTDTYVGAGLDYSSYKFVLSSTLYQGVSNINAEAPKIGAPLLPRGGVFDGLYYNPFLGIGDACANPCQPSVYFSLYAVYTRYDGFTRKESVWVPVAELGAEPPPPPPPPDGCWDQYWLINSIDTVAGIEYLKWEVVNHRSTVFPPPSFPYTNAIYEPLLLFKFFLNPCPP
jgi:hypothetical protein